MSTVAQWGGCPYDARFTLEATIVLRCPEPPNYWGPLGSQGCMLLPLDFAIVLEV